MEKSVWHDAREEIVGDKHSMNPVTVVNTTKKFEFELAKKQFARTSTITVSDEENEEPATPKTKKGSSFLADLGLGNTGRWRKKLEHTERILSRSSKKMVPNESTVQYRKGNFLSLSFILILKFLKSISSVFSIKFSSSIFTFTKPSKPFGGLTIILVGDLYQLPPVFGKPLFHQDDGSLTENLWNKFQKWELTEVVRQKDKSFIDLLTYVRKRKKSTPFDPHHLATLRSRCVKVPDDNIIRIYPTNKPTLAYNCKMLQTTRNPIITVTALDTIATRTGDRVLAAPLTTVKSHLPPQIHLSVGARVILTSNVDVENGLSNGARGTITAINSSKCFHGLPTSVHVKFDEATIGSKYRIGFPYAESYDVPIQFQSEMLPSRSIMRHQYPLQLAWSLTVHKVQGQTFPSAVICLSNMFQPGQGYTAMSRVKELASLYIEELNTESLYCDEKIENALHSMPVFSCTSANWYFHDEPIPFPFTIVSQNIEVFEVHRQDIITYTDLLQCDIFCFTETGDIDKPEPPPFSRMTTVASNYTKRKNRGILVFLNAKASLLSTADMSNDHLDFLAVTVVTRQRVTLLIAVVYKPPKTPEKYLMTIPEQLLQLASTNKDIKDTIIVGDFNVNINEESSLPSHFEKCSFQQLVGKYTTRKGTLLDHVYVNSPAKWFARNLVTYYSYHNPVIVELETN
ncbi:uncharacterized protein LOC136037591 [Artemia franciscana]|uniref:uncharacterized protein LOC136037591 n=1 Tax=Artemia franciscana TaxID=6661 RepID=UPI0032DB2973